MIVDRMASDLVLAPTYLRQVIRTASHRYKTYAIPKRTTGYRTIDHPARELKLLQYWILEKVLRRLSVQEAASAYRKGRNVREHVGQHVRQNFLLKIDFRDFFPSIAESDVIRVLTEHASPLRGIVDTDEDRRIVAKITCKGGRLTIGAPTSPAISNAVMFDFDTHWTARGQELQAIYSRYADDLCFSTDRPNVLATILDEVRHDLQQRQSPRLLINDSKTVFTSRRRKRLVTGLVLTPTREISLGRHRKRQIRSQVFTYMLGRLDEAQIRSLRGLIAHAQSVEPTFVESLRRKYGVGTVDLLA